MHRVLQVLVAAACGCNILTGVDQLERVDPEPVPRATDEAETGVADATDDALGATDTAPAPEAAPLPPPPPCDACADGGEADVPPPTVTTTVPLGRDCGGGNCRGGYGGTKDPAEIKTADKQCVDRAFARALDFTIGGEPGGLFCTYNGTGYACDDSCSGCNVMASVTCTKP